MLTIEQTDTAIRETFYGMEEGVEYILNDFWFGEMNRIHKEYGYSTLKDKKEFLFSRSGDKLFVDKKEAFSFKDKTNLSFTFALAFSLAPKAEATLGLARIQSAFALSFAFAVAFPFALQYNSIEKLNKDTCEGKVVEIDGKRYKLTAV